MRGLDLLRGAGAVFRHLDLGQIAFAAVHVVAARADVAGNTCVFHCYHLFAGSLPRPAAVYAADLIFGLPAWP